MAAPEIPAEFRSASWDELENGQHIWYMSTKPWPQGPWVVLDRDQKIIRPLNSMVERRLSSEMIVVRRKDLGA